MQNIEFKERIITICKNIQTDTINNLKVEVEDAQKAANEYGLPKDRYDSFRTQLLRKKDMFSQQLAKAYQQLDLLLQIDPEKHYSIVEFGAMVMTNKQNLFISISLVKVQVDDDIFYAISPAVPIYKAMEGKKVGEEFSFNNVTYKIEKIY